MALKYKVGDKVRIKSLDWYNENKDEYGYIDCGSRAFFIKMSDWCGKIATIKEICKTNCYHLEEYDFDWTDEMIEGLVEEETKPKYEDEVNGEYETNGEFYSTPKYLVRPSGYQFVDENGNVINARKIILEKKKKEYPKTYEECSLITGYEDRIPLKIIGEFTRLINARNAYWKLYGEEMGLGKPWKPDWHDSEKKYTIECYDGEIIRDFSLHQNRTFSFPTPEMRDAFKENFKSEIEICKELL